MSSKSKTPETEQPVKKRRRGIYLLPNLFTTAALFCGFYAIVASMSDRFEEAGIAIFVAMVLDGLDGRVARLTNTQSDFGKEYDSLSDMLSFGVAPALVMYQWGFEGLADYGWLWAKLGWIGAFFFTGCAALRLARFNVRVGVVDKRFFQGLPSPMAAAVVAGAVWVGARLGIEGGMLAIPAFFLTVTAGALMVSNISYYSFKDFSLTRRVRFTTILPILLIFVAIATNPPGVLFVMALTFTASGPIISLIRWRRRRLQRADDVPGSEAADDETEDSDAS
ncbi:MAG: CDP-diacylglycerol--serine O-phosphatidyltransferase [Gammaproteobacteria bacterium]|nr:CDP-diacylglycerol--serine O-phosphatidyltransferase [Gammaproteobacteria bacterium]